jgi:hypothetical protein
VTAPKLVSVPQPQPGDPVVALLTEIRNLLRERLPAPPPVDKRLARLLLAIERVLEEGPWTVSALFYASAEPDPIAVDLRAVVLEIVGRDRPSSAHRRLGRYLAANAGAIAGDLRLERLSAKHRDGVRYRVRWCD